LQTGVGGAPKPVAKQLFTMFGWKQLEGSWKSEGLTPDTMVLSSKMSALDATAAPVGVPYWGKGNGSAA